MADLTYEDMVQQYHKTIVLCKKQPVYVMEISPDGVFYVLNLLTNKTSSVKFSFKDFQSPAMRLGMVNVFDSVVYITRLPYRRMQVGISAQNTKIAVLPVNYPQGKDDTINYIGRLRCPELGVTMTGNYPTIEEAYNNAVESGGACAFDRQFAIDRDAQVWFKETRVGTYKKKEFSFKPEFQHLSILVEFNNEKIGGVLCA